MENVLCSCIKCGEELACFRNAWNGIGNTYFSPIYPPASARDGFIATNSIYKGTPNTQIENSFLQDLACIGCGAVLGLRCDSSPAGHFLRRNQLILRLAAMSVISERTGHKATVSVVERFPLTQTGAIKQPRTRRASTVQPSQQGETPSIINYRQAPNVLSTQALGEGQEQDLEKFKDWARSAIQAQQHGIDRISRASERMERDLNSFKTFMEETRVELATHRQFRDSLKDEELAALKRDIGGIQAELNANRQFKDSLREEEFPVLQEDIEALRSELSETQNSQRDLKLRDMKTLQQSLDELRQKMGKMAHHAEDGPKVPYAQFETLVGDVREVDRKAREVFSVQAELEKFKTRLTSMEKSIRETMPSQRAATSTFGQTPDQAVFAASQKQGGGRASNKSHLLKRMHVQVDESPDIASERPTKRSMDSVAHDASILSSGNTSSKSLTVRFHTRDSPTAIYPAAHGSSAPVPERRNDQDKQHRKVLVKRSNNEPIQFDDIHGNNSGSPHKADTKKDIISSTTQLSSRIPNQDSEILAHNSVRKENASMNLVQEDHDISTNLNSTRKSGEKSGNAITSPSPSKRNLKPPRFRERSDTPDQLSTPYSEGAMIKSVQKRRPGRPSGKSRHSLSTAKKAPMDSDSPLPSIENESEQRAIQLPEPTPPIGSLQLAPNLATDSGHLLTCKECGKTYKFLANLERHMVISSRCRAARDAGVSAPKAEEEMAKKKRKIKERERLATELLEKQ